MFHGTNVGAARLISGLRTGGRPKEEPVVRTAFVVGKGGFSNHDTNYPKRFGPGMYLTDTMKDAEEYALSRDHGAGKQGAIIEAAIDPDSPIHLTEPEFDKIATSRSSLRIAQQLAKQNPKYQMPAATGMRHKPGEGAEKFRKRILETDNFRDMPEDFQRYFSQNRFEEGDKDMKVPYIQNNLIVTAGHRSAANMQLRSGHDYLHITDHRPLYDSPNSQYGIVLRPSSKNVKSIVIPRKVHFLDGISAARTENL